MDAKTYFENAKKAAIARDALICELQSLNNGDVLTGVSYDGVHSHGDSQTSIVGMIERKDKSRETIAALESVLDDALVVLYGDGVPGGVAKRLGTLYADVVCAHWLELQSWRKIAAQFECSQSWCRMIADKTFAYLDKVRRF